MTINDIINYYDIVNDPECIDPDNMNVSSYVRNGILETYHVRTDIGASFDENYIFEISNSECNIIINDTKNTIPLTMFWQYCKSELQQEELFNLEVLLPNKAIKFLGIIRYIQNRIWNITEFDVNKCSLVLEIFRKENEFKSEYKSRKN